MPPSLRVFFRISSLGLCLSTALPLAAQGRWKAGALLQGTVDAAPVSDLLYGLQAGYSDERMFHHQYELQASYLTSRLQAATDNSLAQDWFWVSTVWHFRRQKLFDPVVQLDFGYQRYDLENEEIFGGYLDNDTWVYGAKAGFNLNFGRKRCYSIGYAVGYQQASAPSSYVYPLPFILKFEASFP